MFSSLIAAVSVGVWVFPILCVGNKIDGNHIKYEENVKITLAAIAFTMFIAVLDAI